MPPPNMVAHPVSVGGIIGQCRRKHNNRGTPLPDDNSKGQPPAGGGKRKSKSASDASLSAGRDVGMRVLDFLTADLVQLTRLSDGSRKCFTTSPNHTI